MSRSKLIKNCIGAVLGTALSAFLPDCAGDSPTHFRTDSASSVTIPLGECVIYFGTQLCYRGMDSTQGVFYLNNAVKPIPVDTDTLKHQMTENDITNLFVIESVTPESLKVRNVGFDKY